ncbi:MAG: hypothetical protein A3H49_08210 [Nitrospirae bacterium RIFCSPLOWO2_02_FULL_62_14]|nr:MAG: hypothetical protein A3H49_08210 [Nitrospirae bacterium RIFCSPLOWO2_02_FULL_62_14]OGW70032.1 MAG: hypothetical protein A3A88_06870 [Nitrospirae bacterium RIFCSPLOWO2_01_FULL_62_17]
MSVSIVPEWFRKLDTVVKLGLGVFIGAFVLIWGGMFLTRPDRTIPPYSIGSQEGTAVAVHVPSWTSDTEIETLIYRFQRVAHEGREFGRMKIRPTTDNDPAGRYQRITIYIFANDHWAEPDMLHRYLSSETSRDPAEQAFKAEFEKTVRGYYRLDGSAEEGRIGRIYEVLRGTDTAATAAYARQLFKGPVTAAVGSPSPQAPADKPASSPLSPF